MAVVDARGLITAAGSGVRHLLGYEPDGIVGRAAAGLLAADLPRSVRRQLAGLRACTGEVALRHRDGSRIVLRLRAVPLTDAGRATSWLVTAAAPADPAGPSDPTAALLSRTLVQLPVPVAVYDREGRLVAANESMTRVMGRTEEEMRGLTLWEIEPSRPFDEYDRMQHQVLRTGETPKDIKRFDLRVNWTNTAQTACAYARTADHPNR
ncbi:PAS domain-containing protein (plasmid) [Streptomyces sp. NBC_01276]